MARRHEGEIEWAAPRGGTFAFLRLPSLPRGGSEAYCDALRARSRLMLMPGTLFDLDGGKESDSGQRVRVTYGRKDTPRLLERWSADLAAHGVAG